MDDQERWRRWRRELLIERFRLSVPTAPVEPAPDPPQSRRTSDLPDDELADPETR